MLSSLLIITLILLTVPCQAGYTPAYNYKDDPEVDSVTSIVLNCDDGATTDDEWTWDDLQNDVNIKDNVQVRITCDLDIEGQTIRNVLVQQRGQGSRRFALKSYTIKFGDENTKWRGLDRLLLKKDPAEHSGIRGKLAFDLFRDVPNFASFRTSWHSLTVVLHKPDGSEEVLDIGLYTNYEKGDAAWIERRKLQGAGYEGTDAWLYKVNQWDFRRRSAIRTEEDPRYDRQAMERYIEAEGNRDHSKLIRTMRALNEAADDEFESVLAEHFDLQNLATFVAVAVICGDWDHTSRNMYILSGPESSVWYVYPWDFDKCFDRHPTRVNTHLSLQNVAENYLFRRIMYTIPIKFTALVDAKIDMLYSGVMSPRRVAALAEAYAATVAPWLEPGMPDTTQLTKKPWQREKKDFYKAVNGNVAAWKKNMYLPLGVRTTSLKETGFNTYRLRMRDSVSTTG
ncbi:hypothetical protein SARC_12570, partial [Sphaeroforma arctica JP610]